MQEKEDQLRIVIIFPEPALGVNIVVIVEANYI